jgi:ribosomal protein L12E/L44/L45/RPP1/RPP2
MKHLAAYLLLGLGGNSSPSAKDVKKVLASVGIEADNDRLKALIDELKDKDINEVRRRLPQPLTRYSDLFSCSSSPKARASSLAFHRAARAAVPRPRPAVLLVATPAARRRPRRRRKRRRRSPTRTWALVCSIRGCGSVRSCQLRRAECVRSFLCLAASTVKWK